MRKASGVVTSEQETVIRRVPVSSDSIRIVAKMQSVLMENTIVQRPPNTVLHMLQRSCKTDWDRAKQIAHSITDPAYSLKQYTEDLKAFPELAYYVIDESVSATGSGRTLGDEYQRTVGAFYAIYWMLRLNLDGKEGFSFGVDGNWKPIPKGKVAGQSSEKRLKFYQESSWGNFEQLLLDANLVTRKQTAKGTTQEVNKERVVTMLALTAMHDIMKVKALLPIVQPEHAPYHGYSAGDEIQDHDQALSYIIDHYPELLSSFVGLPATEQLAVAFTQCQLQFNQGWFVQAEAPPGAIFTKFKELMIREHQSKIKPRDIAFYFVHWLSDLAGAEPTPLGGCEKFVCKFPLPVLNSFLGSFSFVEQLANRTETEVMEAYLKMRWAEHQPDLGPVPQGDHAIAKMRLLCMAQMNSVKILKGFDRLSFQDKDVLSVEMARTGCMAQSFSANLIPTEVQKSPLGPALLIYYGPAFLQSLGDDDPTLRLAALAEIYRAARALWPANVAQVATSVTIRIDTVKGLTLDEIHNSTDNKKKVWIMVKHNALEAFVELSSMQKLNQFIASSTELQVLGLDK